MTSEINKPGTKSARHVCARVRMCAREYRYSKDQFKKALIIINLIFHVTNKKVDLSSSMNKFRNYFCLQY